MDYLFRTILLAPVLLPQGLWVRARTPQLPEPDGKRSGQAGSGPPLSILIVGDSAAAGVGASHQDEALLGQLLRRLTPAHRVSFDLRATTGHRTADAIERVQAMAPAQFDVAVTSLGVNDVTSLVGRAEFRKGQAQLRDLLRSKFGVRRLLVSGLPPMHGFPALPQPLRSHLGSRATQFNNDLKTDVAQDAAARFIDVRFTENTSLMASDGFHPGSAVYSEWADRIAKLVDPR